MTERLLRLKQVLELVSVGRATWYSWVATGKAPPPAVRRGKRCVFWTESQIQDFIQELLGDASSR